MNIKFWNQPKSATLEKLLNEKLRKGFKKVWIVSGVTKDTGIELLQDSIEVARNMGSEINIMIGIDRKNTSKDMLMKLLNLGCNLFVHINRDDNKVETRAYVFENDDDSYVYISNGKLSEGGLTTNYCLIQEIIYSKNDDKLFDNFKSVFMHGIEEAFERIGEEEVKLLAEKGEIVARITERKIPSISELYGNTSLEAISNDMYDESSLTNLFEIPEKNDFDIDIDIDFDGKIRKSELSVEMDAKKDKQEKENIEKLATEKLAKLYKIENDTEEDKKVNIIKNIDDIDFSNASIFVFELNKIVDKGVGEGEVKVPLYLYEAMQDFFGNDFELLDDGKGKQKLAKKVKLTILDVICGDTYIDEVTLMYNAGKYFAIKSPVLKTLNLDENDIIRIIKKGNNEFNVELVRKDAKEYDIWKSFCKHSMKNSKRAFGIM